VAGLGYQPDPFLGGRSLGIIIYMYYKDHSPPHFHAEYNEYSITVEIETGVVEGRFPKRALSAILE